MQAHISELFATAFRRQSVASAVAVFVFLAALYIFMREQQAIGGVNGWWGDELFSLWASDPLQSFTVVFLNRILPDSTPPLYYSVLYWMRHLIADERRAATFVNLAALTASVLSVLYISKKTKTLALGLIGCAVFLLSGPVLTYTAESRSYLSALALTFIASWFCASTLLHPQRPPAWTSFALLGTLSALIHIYSALMCCCLAAGLLVAARFWRRSDLWAPSLALGVPAGMLASAWLVYAYAVGLFGHFAWIPFSPDKIVISAGEVILLAFPLGADIAAVDFALHTAGAPLRDVILAAAPGIIAFGMIVLILCFGFFSKRLSATSTAFGTCFVLFFALPVIASYHTPIITGRYWLIGAPAAIVLLLVSIRGWIDDVSEKANGWSLSLGVAAAAAAFVGLTTCYDFDAARAFVMVKPAWSGGTLVSSMIRNCPPRSIHVHEFFGTNRAVRGLGTYSYGFVSNMPKDTFVPVFRGEFVPGVGSEEERNGSRIGYSCPVLGWAEHVISEIVRVDVQKATDQELLDLLKIEVLPADVQILRHRKGYIVLRRIL
jgi:hypothetical protein